MTLSTSPAAQTAPAAQQLGSTPHDVAQPSYYDRHIFFCTNVRTDGRAFCGSHGLDAAKHCKAAVKAAGLSGAGKVRVNQAGCLDRCAAGPVCVVYPEAVWYSFVDAHDIDEIVESHLKNGVVVERLRTAAHLGA